MILVAAAAAAATVALVLLSSCAPSNSSVSAAQSAGNGRVGTLSGTGSGNSPTVVTPSPTPTPSTDPLIGVPAYSFQIRGTGYVSRSVTVRTYRKLKVMFTPGIQDSTVAGSGFSPQYSRLGVYIGVTNLTQPTPMMYNGAAGTTASNSGEIDLSSGFTRTCGDNTPTCRQAVIVTVSKPNYDYWCLNYGSYCPWTHVYDTHPWNGELQIQTDDTDPVTAQP